MIICKRPRSAATWMCIICLSPFLLTGCSPQEYKDQADEQVYEIIDEKWTDNFGPKVNYTIGDVPPSSGDIQIEKAIPESGIITLARAISIATAHNRDYQRQKELLYLTTLDLTLARRVFEPQFFGSFDADYVKDGDDENIQAGSDLSVEKLLAEGTDIGITIGLDWARFLTGDPRTSLGSVLAVTVTQPLMRGSGRQIVLENLTQAEREVLYRLRTFARFRKTFVISIIDGYYRVLQAYDSVKNTENNYKNLTDVQQQQEELVKAGRIPRFQVDQTEQDTLRARDRFIRATQQYEQALDNFKLTLALTTDLEFSLDPNELVVLADAGVIEPDYSVPEAVEVALVNRLDLASERDRLDDAERKIKVAENNLQAQFDLVANVGVGSDEDSESARLQFNDGRYSAGFRLDLPFERTRERNAYRERLIDLMKTKRDYEQAEDIVKLEVRQAYRKLAEAAASYEVQQKSLQLAYARVEITPLLIEAGKAIPRDLLESQNALLEAQGNTTAALIDYTIAKLTFFNNVGILQVKPDGMWDTSGI